VSDELVDSDLTTERKGGHIWGHTILNKKRGIGRPNETVLLRAQNEKKGETENDQQPSGTEENKNLPRLLKTKKGGSKY